MRTLAPLAAFGALVSLSVVAGVLACTDATQPRPVLTAAVVSLKTPNVDDGAVILLMNGPDLSLVDSASSEYLVYSRFVDTDQVRVIVIGNVVTGPLFSIPLPAGSDLRAYSVSVEQVAARSDTLRDDLAGYRLTLTSLAR